MEFIDPYLKDVGSLLPWLAKFETNITALQVVQATAAILGIILSTLGIYKAWRFAERRLAERLIEFLDTEEKKLSDARAVVRAVRDQRSARGLTRQPIFSNDELQKALRVIGARRFGAKRYDAAEIALQNALDATTSRAKVAHRLATTHEKQRAAAHLLLGAIADAKGDHQKALLHFLSALEIDEQDVEALEYVGHQHLKLGNAPQALAEFSKLKAIARARGDALLTAQASRNCGLAYQAKSLNSPWSANQQYLEAINAFPQDGPQLELAYIYELRGLASIELNFRNQAYDCLMQALARYVEHERAQRGGKTAEPTSSERVIAALKTLQQINNGATADGDGDGGSSGDGNGAPANLPLPTDQQHIPNQPSNGISPN